MYKHEKYTSQLQMGIKSAESKQQNLQEERSKLERSERKSLTGKSDQKWPKSGEKDTITDSDQTKCFVT